MGRRLTRFRYENYKDPYDFERRTAERLGGRVEVASGAFSGEYDVHSDDWVVDNKLTAKKSFSVKIENFKGIERVAIEKGKMPLMAIHFDEYGETLIVLRSRDFYGMEGK